MGDPSPSAQDSRCHGKPLRPNDMSASNIYWTNAMLVGDPSPSAQDSRCHAKPLRPKGLAVLRQRLIIGRPQNILQRLPI